MRKREKKPAGMVGKVIKTGLSAVVSIILIIVMVAANSLLPAYSRMVNCMLGYNKSVDNSKVDTTGLDLEYYKSDYTKDEIVDAEIDLNKRIAGEGIVLLKNDDAVMPFASGTTFSFFSANSDNFASGGMMGGGQSLKEVFEEQGFGVNETLWSFYTEGGGKEYGLAAGSISFGDAEDFSINECPLSVLQAEEGLLDSAKDTVPVYVLKRVAGEGRDMPRSMYNHADNAKDQVKSYIEPDSKELEVLQYLNDNFKNVVMLINSNAAMELDWLNDFPSIHAVVYAPAMGSYGMYAIPGIFDGSINPSGRTVDTFAANALASPAAQNFGDYAYYDEDGNLTKYNYVSYAEGIYVGYKYYETRYEDVVLQQGNAGAFDYTAEVCYPFGYGLSYTTFEWANQTMQWNGTDCTVTVDVTNIGDVSGKEVVELYAQSPYTEYDKANNVEKASVMLVGYAKTGELAPGETETVAVTFSKEQLKAYDYTTAKTYILDAGDYYITAARNAHEAVNNILAAKGKTVADGMTAEGNAQMVSLYVPENAEVDIVTYVKDTYSGTDITNQLDTAAGDITYLSRKDWMGTFPEHDGIASDVISTWGNEINGVDAEGNAASYTYYKTVSDELLGKIDSFDSLNPMEPSTLKDEIVYGKDNGLSLIDMRGLDFDDPLWQDLLDQLTLEDYQTTITLSGYGSVALDSVNKPFCVDADTANGLIYGGTGTFFPNMMVLAQTWNQDLALEYGEMIGNEGVLGGADGWYAPSMNIHRTPFSGRNGEYYSEDAFLSGIVASKEVYGAASKGMYTFIKHLAFNDQENHRGDREGQYSICTWLNEQAAREIYLLPFEMCMKVGDVDLNYVKKNADGTYENAKRKIPACQAVMTAFNRIGYTWTGGSYPLITGILRNEWDFNGFIITDNANTGVFMDAYQMIEAGADAKLTYEEAAARYTFDADNVAEYHYGRAAMHRILYTVANSKAMNGGMPGSVYVDGMQISQKVQIAVNVVCSLLILLMVICTVVRFRKKPIINNID